jgi:hypothetical protein
LPEFTWLTLINKKIYYLPIGEIRKYKFQFSAYPAVLEGELVIINSYFELQLGILQEFTTSAAW